MNKKKREALILDFLGFLPVASSLFGSSVLCYVQRSSKKFRWTSQSPNRSSRTSDPESYMDSEVGSINLQFIISFMGSDIINLFGYLTIIICCVFPAPKRPYINGLASDFYEIGAIAAEHNGPPMAISFGKVQNLLMEPFRFVNRIFLSFYFSFSFCADV